jgi:hypothetical protein
MTGRKEASVGKEWRYKGSKNRQECFIYAPVSCKFAVLRLVVRVQLDVRVG